MTETGERLVLCFLSILPDLTADEIRKTNINALSDLDSWSTATLMVVIEEEFGIKLSFDQLWELGTFQAIEKHLLERCQLSSERSEPLTD